MKKNIFTLTHSPPRHFWKIRHFRKFANICKLYANEQTPDAVTDAHLLNYLLGFGGGCHGWGVGWEVEYFLVGLNPPPVKNGDFPSIFRFQNDLER